MGSVKSLDTGQGKVSLGEAQVRGWAGLSALPSVREVSWGRSPWDADTGETSEANGLFRK